MYIRDGVVLVSGIKYGDVTQSSGLRRCVVPRSPQAVRYQRSSGKGLTWVGAACTELCTDMVILLQGLFKVENPQIVLAHGKVDATKIIPEHASQAFT